MKQGSNNKMSYPELVISRQSQGSTTVKPRSTKKDRQQDSHSMAQEEIKVPQLSLSEFWAVGGVGRSWSGPSRAIQKLSALPVPPGAAQTPSVH